MSFIKETLKKVLHDFGYQIQRAYQSQYIELTRIPRYVPHEIDFMGQPLIMVDGASFYSAYDEIFNHHIYDFTSTINNPRIIDCGANIGLSIIYFKTLYPNATITGIEADPKIFPVLCRNIEAQGFSGVTLLDRAVAAKTGTVSFHQDGADGGRIVSESCDGPMVFIGTITLDDLITDPIDFLKIDIEGAETEAICACTKLSLVQNIFVEYHSFSNKPQTLNELLNALQKAGFRYYVKTIHSPDNPFKINAMPETMDLQLNIFCVRDSSK